MSEGGYKFPSYPKLTWGCNAPFHFINNSRIIHLRKFMKLLTLTASNIAPFFIAAVVSASTAFLGFGFYHGTFHINANQAHCHQDGICHNH